MDRYWISILLVIGVAAQDQFAHLGLNNGTHFMLFERQLSSISFGNFSSNPNINAIENLELPPKRIVNGKRISCRRAPYQVALRYQGYFICGGSILSRHWVLTAAHCVANSRGRFMVRVGSSQQHRGVELHRVKFIVSNAGYNDYGMQNDLAMVRLAKPIRYGSCAQPARLPSSRRKYLPTCFLVSGWGLKREKAQNVELNLRATVVCGVDHNRCSRMYRKVGIRIYWQILCAQRVGHDSCSGDSGGPLAVGRTLYGVVSFGIGCANKYYPGVYVSVKRFKKWIYWVARRYS